MREIIGETNSKEDVSLKEKHEAARSLRETASASSSKLKFKLLSDRVYDLPVSDSVQTSSVLLSFRTRSRLFEAQHRFKQIEAENRKLNLLRRGSGDLRSV